MSHQDALDGLIAGRGALDQLAARANNLERPQAGKRALRYPAEGHAYGGGLHKMEPKELAQIPARLVLGSIGMPVRVEEQLPCSIDRRAAHHAAGM